VQTDILIVSEASMDSRLGVLVGRGGNAFNLRMDEVPSPIFKNQTPHFKPIGLSEVLVWISAR
jgi:hypothetical protein